MELKEFVKETLLQLTIGVKEAQEECKKFGCLVNPMLETPIALDEEKFEISGKYYPATNVLFKVGLTENVGTENKKGIGVFLSSISVGAEQKKDASIQSVTNIEFRITLVPPFIGRDLKVIDTSGLLL